VNDRVFCWEVISGDATIDDPDSALTIVNMPAEDVTVVAIYSNEDNTLVVNNGDGDGEYSSGTSVTITADSCPAVQEFD